MELGPGKYLYESLVVSDYLDETFPNNQLRPADPFQKAVDRMWVEEFSKVRLINTIEQTYLCRIVSHIKIKFCRAFRHFTKLYLRSGLETWK